MSAPHLCRTQPVVAATEAKTAVLCPESILQAAACRAPQGCIRSAREVRPDATQAGLDRALATVQRLAPVPMKNLGQVCWFAALGEGRQWASRRASTSCSKAGTSTAR